MALCTSSRSICLCPLRLLGLKKLFVYSCSYVHQPIKEDTGVLDDFTSQLMQRKSNKWENRKNLLKKKAKCNVPAADMAKDLCNNITLQNLDIDAISELFQKALDYDDSASINDLTKQCLKYDKIPSLTILLQVLSMCSKNGDKDTILEVSQLCEKIRPEILQENSNFEHYIAEAVWIRGNVVKSLELFQSVYKENIYLRRRIRSILKYLILDSVSIHSEATVINLLQFSDVLVKEYNDYFPMGCLWQACILSEWFTDQQIALELLDKYPYLSNVVVNKIPFVVRLSLRNHKTEVVYRLTEALLRLKMENEVAEVVLALLNYWIQQGDLRQSKEIVLWALENDIHVPAIIHNKQFMKAFARDVQANPDIDVPKQTPRDFKF